MTESKLFFGGVPTAPDVRKMIDVVLALAPGHTVTYEALSAQIEVSEESSRFQTVLRACRRELEQAHNVATEAVRGVGIRRLPEDERAAQGAKTFRGGVRRVKRSVEQVSAIKTELLDENQRAMATHVRRVVAAAYTGLQESRVELAAALKPPKTLPR